MVVTKESVKRKLNVCTQGNDTVNIYASKLEELDALALEPGDIG